MDNCGATRRADMIEELVTARDIVLSLSNIVFSVTFFTGLLIFTLP